eukprot:TRINITY_DN587_c0_g1_i1.p1 TRINITY_DN587_c0_g1~~TRINITY_DN587_c0_g1_i1.p1  ORF type:complete len:912 (+),score=205.21 TRINITY_DN587_c0_g1_i1:61-2796(+)
MEAVRSIFPVAAGEDDSVAVNLPRLSSGQQTGRWDVLYSAVPCGTSRSTPFSWPAVDDSVATGSEAAFSAANVCSTLWGPGGSREPTPGSPLRLPTANFAGTSRVTRRANRKCATHAHAADRDPSSPGWRPPAATQWKHAIVSMSPTKQPGKHEFSPRPPGLTSAGRAFARLPQTLAAVAQAEAVQRGVECLREAAQLLRTGPRTWEPRWLDPQMQQRRAHAAACLPGSGLPPEAATQQGAAAAAPEPPQRRYSSDLPEMPQEAGLDGPGTLHRRIQQRIGFFRSCSAQPDAEVVWQDFSLYCREVLDLRRGALVRGGQRDHIARNKAGCCTPRGTPPPSPAPDDHRRRVLVRSREQAVRTFATRSRARARRLGCPDTAAALGMALDDPPPPPEAIAAAWCTVAALVGSVRVLIAPVWERRAAEVASLAASDGRYTRAKAAAEIQGWFRRRRLAARRALERRGVVALGRILHSCIVPAAARARWRVRSRGIVYIKHFLRWMHRQSLVTQAMRGFRMRVRRCQRVARTWLLCYQARIQLWDTQLRLVEDYIHEREASQAPARPAPAKRRGQRTPREQEEAPAPAPLHTPDHESRWLPPGWRQRRRAHEGADGRRQRKQRGSPRPGRHDDKPGLVYAYVAEERRRKRLAKAFRSTRSRFWAERDEWRQAAFRWKYHRETAKQHRDMLVQSAGGAAAAQLEDDEQDGPPPAPHFPVLLPLRAMLRMAEGMIEQERVEREARVAAQFSQMGEKVPRLTRQQQQHAVARAAAGGGVAVLALAGALCPEGGPAGGLTPLELPQADGAAPTPTPVHRPRPLSPALVAPPQPEWLSPAEHERDLRQVAACAVQSVMSTPMRSVRNPLHFHLLAESKARSRRAPQLPNRSPPPRRAHPASQQARGGAPRRPSVPPAARAE